MAIQREKILSCASELCLSEGVDAFSMRKLARAVGVTAPALYRHYESKEEVLLDVVNEAYRLHMEYLSGALVGATPLERFELAGQAYLNFAMEHPRFYELLFTYAEVLGLEEIPEGTLARARAAGHFWQDRVRELMAAGLLEEGDPDQVSATMWAFAHGLISLYLRRLLPLREDDFRDFVDVAFSRLMCGLATEEFAAGIKAEMAVAGLEEKLSGALQPKVIAERKGGGAGGENSGHGGAGDGGPRTAHRVDPNSPETWGTGAS